MDRLDCLCKAYNPSTSSRKELSIERYGRCLFNFETLFKSYDDSLQLQLYDSFFNKEENDNDAETTCESKLNSIPEDFCGFPWDENPFSSRRSTFYCSKTDKLSCDSLIFDIKCKWFDNSCVATLFNELVGEGVCASFKSQEECNTFKESGLCLWHEKNTDEEMALVSVLERNCCGVDSTPVELNESHKINTFEPSVSPSPTALHLTSTPSTKTKEDLYEVSTIVSESKRASSILVAASGISLFVLLFCFWKKKKNMLFSRNRDTDHEFVDPSQFEHVAPQDLKKQEKIEDTDPSMFEHIVSEDLKIPVQFEEIVPSMFEHIVP